MTSTYEVYLSYDPEKDNLASSLAFLSEIVGNQTKADNIMASGLAIEPITPRIILQDIKKDSIRLFLANVIRNTQADEIRDKGLLAFFNQFLVEVREPFLEYASNHKTLETRADLQKLKQEAIGIANRNKINSLPLEGIADIKIAQYLKSYSVPGDLGKNQYYEAIYNGKRYRLRRDFTISDERIEEILNNEVKTFKDVELYLTPKKICYQGEAMWEFATVSGTPLKARISDSTWLDQFQSNELPSHEYPFPRTVLKVRADISAKSDGVGFRKEYQGDINKVYGVVPPNKAEYWGILDV